MKKKILASAPTKEVLEKLINEYFYSTNYIIKDDRPYSIKSGYAPDKFMVTYSKGRYRFIREED